MTTPSGAQSNSNQPCVAAVLRRCLTVRSEWCFPAIGYFFRSSNHNSVSFYCAVKKLPTINTLSVLQSISNQ